MTMKIVTHLAVKHKPPCLKFQYTKSSSIRSYHKNVRINLSKTRDCAEAYVAAIVEKHLELSQVPRQTLVDLIDSLSSYRATIQTEKSSSDDNLLSNIFYSPTKNVSKKLTLRSYEDLNHASEEELTLAKKEMNVLFEHTSITPGDVRYEYDKRVEFEADEESSWD
jgi:hypothetical protein